MDADARLLIVLAGCAAPAAVWLLVPLVDAIAARARLGLEALGWAMVFALIDAEEE